MRRLGVACGLAAAVFFGLTASAQALILNPALPITQQVRVQIIQVADNAGANAAPLFGSASEQSAIFGLVDAIWAQAGIDVEFYLRSGTYNNTFTLTGNPGSNNPRPTGDLNLIRSAASSNGVLDSDSNVLNLFVTRIVPGFSQTSDNTSNGLAFLDSNGIAFWAGPNLTGFNAGREVIASVLSHEIGHNLGLDHIVSAENLMQSASAANQGERLNAAQINQALASSFSTLIAVPEPGSLALLALGAGFSLVGVYRRRKAA